MELFNVFRDTIFLKEDSVLERQILELKTIRDKVKEKKQISKNESTSLLYFYRCRNAKDNDFFSKKHRGIKEIRYSIDYKNKSPWSRDCGYHKF